MSKQFDLGAVNKNAPEAKPNNDKQEIKGQRQLVAAPAGPVDANKKAQADKVTNTKKEKVEEQTNNAAKTTESQEKSADASKTAKPAEENKLIANESEKQAADQKDTK